MLAEIQPVPGKAVVFLNCYTPSLVPRACRDLKSFHEDAFFEDWDWKAFSKDSKFDELEYPTLIGDTDALRVAKFLMGQVDFPKGIQEQHEDFGKSFSRGEASYYFLMLNILFVAHLEDPS